MQRQVLISAVLIGAMANPAMAHIGLAQGEAVVGSTFRATLVVGHGCAGAATTQVKV